MGAFKDEMRSICKLSKLAYRPPLPRKKQRTNARAESNGPIRVYTEEEKLLYMIKNFNLAKKFDLPY